MKREMFALSFTALFLEMMVIRWVPSVVHLVAYYANLMLLSSFLGLGAGAIAAGRKWNLFRWFPLLLACDIGMLLMDRNTVLGTSASESHFFALPPSMFNAFVLVRIFGMNALLFVPLGQRMGVLFHSLPRLTAYAWDLAGSLSGTLCFGAFSLLLFSPGLGMAIVTLVYLAISPRRRWFLHVPLFAGVLAMIVWTGDKNAIWSPYYYITVDRIETQQKSEPAPPPEALIGQDPPVYLVRVNQFGYHYDGALDISRYTPGSLAAGYISWLEPEYKLPYALTNGFDRVLVVGAGGGFDVEAALACGVKHVDAVEIDPAIIGISRRFNAGAPYEDPRVAIHIDDARSYLAKATPGYDLVVFGFLDSQALFSTMNNVRLDGYVYTVESIRTAYRLLNDRGMLSLSFYLGRPWLGPKLYELVEEATGKTPTMYFDDKGQTLILCVSRDPGVVLPQKVAQFHKAGYGCAAEDRPADGRLALPLPVHEDHPVRLRDRHREPAGVLHRGDRVPAAPLVRARGRPFRAPRDGLPAPGDQEHQRFDAVLRHDLVCDDGGRRGRPSDGDRCQPRGGAPQSGFSFANVRCRSSLILALLFIVPRENILEFGLVGRLLWTRTALGCSCSWCPCRCSSQVSSFPRHSGTRLPRRPSSART